MNFYICIYLCNNHHNQDIESFLSSERVSKRLIFISYLYRRIQKRFYLGLEVYMSDFLNYGFNFFNRHRTVQISSCFLCPCGTCYFSFSFLGGIFQRSYPFYQMLHVYWHQDVSNTFLVFKIYLGYIWI